MEYQCRYEIIYETNFVWQRGSHKFIKCQAFIILSREFFRIMVIDGTLNCLGPHWRGWPSEERFHFDRKCLWEREV